MKKMSIPYKVIEEMEKKTPQVATDMILEYVQNNQSGLIVINRKYPPFGLALPGGKLENDLELEANAIKETLEETNLSILVDSFRFFDFYAGVHRDPRCRRISFVYQARGVGEFKAGSDAKGVYFKTHDEIKSMFGKEMFAFDHEQILQDYYLRDEQ